MRVYLPRRCRVLLRRLVAVALLFFIALAVLFFLALLPQFIDPAASNKTLVFLALGAWFIVQSGVFLGAFVLLVAPLGRWRPPAAVERSLQALGGAIFVGLAARLALAQRH